MDKCWKKGFIWKLRKSDSQESWEGWLKWFNPPGTSKSLKFYVHFQSSPEIQWDWMCRDRVNCCVRTPSTGHGRSSSHFRPEKWTFKFFLSSLSSWIRIPIFSSPQELQEGETTSSSFVCVDILFELYWLPLYTHTPNNTHNWKRSWKRYMANDISLIPYRKV